jgi:hypothetical protein
VAAKVFAINIIATAATMKIRMMDFDFILILF